MMDLFSLKKGSFNFDTFLSIGLLLFIFLSSLIFAFYGTGSRSMWLDEATSVFISNSSLADLPGNLKKPGTPPFYYLLLAGWIRIFGISEIGVRSLSSVFYLASLVGIFHLGKLLFSNKSTVPLICVLIYMISPLAVRHAQNARPYSLLVFLVILSLFSFFQMSKSNFKFSRFAILFIITTMFGYFTHYWFAFFVLAEFVAFCVYFFSLKEARNYILFNLLSFFPFLIIWVPILIWQLGAKLDVSLGHPSWRVLYETILDIYGGGLIGLTVILAFLLLPMVHFKNWSLGVNRAGTIFFFLKRKETKTLLLLFCLCIIIPYLVSQFRPIFLVGRYTVIILPMFILFSGGILGETINSRVTIAVLVLLTIASLVFFIRHRLQGDPRPDRVAANYLLNHANKNDFIFYTSLSRGAIEYYLLLSGREKDFIQFSFPLEVSDNISFFDTPKFSANKPLLGQEAENIVKDLNKKVKENQSIWLFYGKEIEISSILLTKLENNFRLIQKADIPGPFHDSIYQFVKR